MQAAMQLSLLWLFHIGSCTSAAPRRTWHVKSEMPCSLGAWEASLYSGTTTMVGCPRVMYGLWEGRGGGEG